MVVFSLHAHINLGFLSLDVIVFDKEFHPDRKILVNIIEDRNVQREHLPALDRVGQTELGKEVLVYKEMYKGECKAN